MASLGYITSLLNKLEADLKSALTPAFEHTLTTFQLGGNRKALNFKWIACNSTTSSTASDEFSVEHGMESAPTKLIPIMDLTQVGSQLVPLVVSRAPDTRRVYLKSSSTSAVINFYLE